MAGVQLKESCKFVLSAVSSESVIAGREETARNR